MSDFIILKNVRINFPHLFNRPIINGQESKYGAMLMIDNDDQKQIDKCNAKIKAMLEANKVKKLPSEKLFIRDGEDKGRDECIGYQVVSASNAKKPLVLDAKKEVVGEEESKIYSGCYVNAKIKPWYQDNKYGKRVNAELIAVQFAKDGEPLDGAYISPETAVEGFDELEEEDEDWMSAE